MNTPLAHRPYIPANTRLPEMTLRAVITGAILGVIFGASSLYLVLKVGLTVSASIPVAVISITLFRMFSKLGIRDGSILEHNIVQTTGSAGESIAFGVGVTMPAILILGFDLELMRVVLVSILGGLLGILMMIPLRRALIVNQHGLLKYPEGTACAEVLKAGASPESRAAADPQAAGAGIGGISARTIFTGFGIGLAYKTLNIALKGWRDVPGMMFGAPLKGGSLAAEISPELLGVGYIIGPRIASMMFAGGAMAALLLIPMLMFFGAPLTTIIAPGTIPISEMSASDIRNAYVLYIGAGAVAAGGIISLVRGLPLIIGSVKHGIDDIRAARAGKTNSDRREQDLSLKFVGIGIIVLMAMILIAPSLHMNLLGALLIVIFGALFVTVSSRLTGEIGSSSNPVSGMTIATLMLTCLVFLIVGWTGGVWYVTALSVGGIVCIASSNGGTTSQDLKTGFLIGGTPKLQQISILIGAFASALLMGPILLKLNDNATVFVPIAQVAPQGLSVDVATLPADATRQALTGMQAEPDAREYRVWHKTDTVGGPAGKYLVDDAGNAVWLVDPGINGAYTTRPDGTEVRKFDAPKATLVSYIIKGILDRELPWELILFG
ncbi:MAG: oligopeptide transporter, OPT family, partial [Nevskiaceae bacterium]|nr:oligopeptide transporter, OPT family [Nevskiaceae bacterium]